MGSRFVVDSSAILALLGSEPGADEVENALLQGSVISSVNLCEVTGNLAEVGIGLDQICHMVSELGLEVVAFDSDCAYRAGMMRPQIADQGLSLGDRACICLGVMLGLPVVTADRRWRECNLPIDLRLIR